MSWRAAESLRAHVALVAVAAISMLALAVTLMRDVIASTEQRLVREARQQCSTAAHELAGQYAERARLREETAEELPFEAQDVSLRGLSAAVLRSYDNVVGGFHLSSGNRLAGLSDPSFGGLPSLGSSASTLVREVAARALRERQPVTEEMASGNDIFVIAAEPSATGGASAWSLKRLPGVRDPVGDRRRWWLAGLLFSAVLGLAGIIFLSIRLRRGVESVSEGLRRLEEDFSYRMPAQAGDFRRIAGAINQMAERRAGLETSLRRQDRLAALGKVVAGVAHEIRNPINSIRLTLELLNRRVQKGSATGQEVREAIAEVDRLDRILARLLAFGRPELDDRRLQDVRPLLDRATRMVSESSQRKGVRIDIEVQGGEPLRAEVDGLQVEQVLINLLLNAIDASPPQGRVQVLAAEADGHLNIAVRDEGAGIPAAAREHVFDPYFTTKETGSGLGLAVSREVATCHGGTLELHSNGTGTTFVLSLPLRGSL